MRDGSSDPPQDALATYADGARVASVRKSYRSEAAKAAQARASRHPVVVDDELRG